MSGRDRHMRHSYVDQSPAPAALMLGCEVHFAGRPDLTVKVQAKLDTGSDMTAIPRWIVERRGIVRFGDRVVRQTGRNELTYHLTVHLDAEAYTVEAVANSAPYVLIGRDILNQLRLVADG